MAATSQEARLQELIARIQPPDEAAAAAARARQDRLTKPKGSLGRLEELSIQLAGLQARSLPKARDKAVFVLAGDHGVAVEGVSAYPQEVTAQMVLNFLRGGAAINVLARHAGVRVIVVDMGVAAELPADPRLVRSKVAPGTGNIAQGPAMTRAQALQALLAGAELVEQELERGLDLVATGEMGIANTTPSAAIACALAGLAPEEVVGRGSGIDEEGWRRKVAVVERSLAVNNPDPADALDVLAKVGGFEIGGLAGLIVAAAARRLPIVIDGFISTAAAMLAVTIAPQARPYLIAAHRSQEKGHRLMLEWLGLRPVLALDLRLGEGTGAVLAMFVVEAACKVLAEMATFEEAGVSDRSGS